MPFAKRWSWIPLLLLALAAAAFPAMLHAKPAPTTTAVAPVTLARQTLPVDKIPLPRPSSDLEASRNFDNGLQNLCLSLATGFAAGLTVFFCIAGWGLFRVGLSRHAALAALLVATATCFSGFLFGFSGFLQIVGS